MLKTNIFAGGITNLTDARYFAARGAQYLSFNLDSDTANVSNNVAKMAAIKEWVEGPSFIGVFQTTPIKDIQLLIERLSLNLVQLGPFIPLEELHRNPINIPLIREVIIEQLSDLNFLQNQMKSLSEIFDFILLNFEKNGLSWSSLKNHPGIDTLLKNWSMSSKIILAISHLPEETNEILSFLNPYGLYLQGGEEEKVGFKSYDDLDEILDCLEQEYN